MFTIGMLGIVALSAMPITAAVAGEQSVGPAAPEFQALSSLPDARRVELTMMTEEQLSAVEGAVFHCVVCVNAAKIRQAILARIHKKIAATIRDTHAVTIRDTHAVTIRQTNVNHSTVNTHQTNSAVVVQRK